MARSLQRHLHFHLGPTNSGKTYEAHTYPGTNHGFHNDSTPRYDEQAAKLAWERSIAWFKRHLA